MSDKARAVLERIKVDDSYESLVNDMARALLAAMDYEDARQVYEDTPYALEFLGDEMHRKKKEFHLALAEIGKE